MYPAVLLLVAVVSSVNAGGAVKCSWGPGYWCQSRQNAEECKAVKYCEEKVWPRDMIEFEPEQQALTISPEEIECDTCNFTLSELKKVLGDKDIQESAVAFLQQGCAQLPSSILQEACDLFVKTEIPAAMQHVADDIDPTEVCQSLHLCPEEKAVTFVEEQQPEGWIICKFCKFAVGQFVDYLTGIKYIEAFKKTLQAICYVLPQKEKDICDKYFINNIELIVKYIRKIINAEKICQIITLCDMGDCAKRNFISQLGALLPAPKVKSVECDFCKYVGGEVKTVLGSNQTQAMIVETLGTVCDMIPLHDVREMCEAGVQELANVVKHVADEMDPLEVCQDMQMCSAQLAVVTVARAEVSDPADCIECKLTVEAIVKAITENKYIDEFKDTLKLVCKILPKYNDECVEYVDKYTNLIVEYVTSLIDPTDLCTIVGACP